MNAENTHAEIRGQTCKVSRRRSCRLLVPYPIRVVGRDAGGSPFAEETVTVSVNKHGACVILTHSVLAGERVRVKNLQNGMEGEFRIVAHVQDVFGNRREWGVEALDAESRIWGVDFNVPIEATQPHALIQCTLCDQQLLSSISIADFKVLLHTGMVSRHCECCCETTRWKPANQLRTPANAPRNVEVGSFVEDRRRERRLRLSMHLWVENGNSESETVETLDVSSRGARFVTKKMYQAGEVIYVSLPSEDSRPPVKIRARVVWSVKGSRDCIYGVMYVSG